jgi:undecaprenyl-diphosphatase
MLPALGKWGTSLRTDGRMLVRFLIACAALFLLAKLGSEVIEGETLAFDRAIMTALRQPHDLSMPIGPRWLTLVIRDFTALGGVAVLTLLTVVTAGYLVVARKAHSAVFLIAATVSGSLLSTLLKGLFQRPRPDIVAHLVDVSTTSFPSGHAMNSAIVYLTLGGLLARTHHDRRIRIYILTVAILLTLIIGCSRVFLGVHWPTDVLAGWTIGAIWALFCSWIARQLQARGEIEAEGD